MNEETNKELAAIVGAEEKPTAEVSDLERQMKQFSSEYMRTHKKATSRELRRAIERKFPFKTTAIKE